MTRAVMRCRRAADLQRADLIDDVEVGEDVAAGSRTMPVPIPLTCCGCTATAERVVGGAGHRPLAVDVDDRGLHLLVHVHHFVATACRR